jgi:hypothetical protein
MKMKTWLPNLILGLSIYALATGPSVAQQLATVNCPAESIQAAIDAATPGGALIITINGICNENVTIVRDRVTLLGGTNGGVTGQTADRGAIDVFAHGAVIDDLTVSGGAGAGIRARSNGAVTVQNSTIEGNALSGVDAGNGGFALIDNNTIRFNGECEIVARDAGMARVTNNSIVSTQPDENICSAVGVFRGRMRMAGGNTVQNTTPTGFAIAVFGGAQFRQSGGHDIVSGPVEVGGQSYADFRDVAITGPVGVFSHSLLRMRDLGSVPNNVTVTGDININETNVVTFSSPTATINGTINCNGGTLFGSLTATAINCPAPLHVLRSNGTAKVLAQDTQVPANPAAPQTMFELIRPGALRFDLVDENLGVTWVFQNRNDAFDITKAGTGVQEFKLEGNGNLTVLGTATAAAHLTASDRNLKENFVDLEGTQVLAKLSALPVTEWSFKRDPVRHIGPTAQDFKAAFGLGADDTHIASLDVASVAVLGVKVLHQMIEERNAEIAKRDARVTVLEARLAELEATLARVLAAQRTTPLAVAHTVQHH